MLKRTLAGSAIVAGLLLMTGCGDRPEVTTVADGNEIQPAVTDATLSATMPLASFIEDQVTFIDFVDDAIQRGVRACMAEAGFSVESPDSGVALPSAASSRYGLTDLDEASVYGYHGGAEGGGDGDTAEAMPTDDPKYVVALFGEAAIATHEIKDSNGEVVLSSTLTDGCIGQAMLGVFGSSAEYFTFRETLFVLENVANQSWEELQEAPAFRELNLDWAACMRAEGVTRYASPMEPIQGSWEAKPITDDEIAAATADVVCKDSTDYVTRASALEGEIQARLLTAHLGLLAQFEQSKASVSARVG